MTDLLCDCHAVRTGTRQHAFERVSTPFASLQTAHKKSVRTEACEWLQVSTDAEVAELQARLQSVQQEAQAQVAAQAAQALDASAAEAAPAAEATPAGPQLSIGALLAGALPQPVVKEFALPSEYSLMRSIPYQHVDVNRYPPQHRPKKQRAGQIPVRFDSARVLLRRAIGTCWASTRGAATLCQKKRLKHCAASISA